MPRKPQKPPAEPKRVPREYESRDPHPHEWGSRYDRTCARHRFESRTAGVLNHGANFGGCSSAIINDVLDFSKIEAGMLELNLVEFHPRENIEETLRALALTAHQKGLELVCDIDRSVPEVLFGDSLRIRQVLVNLVGNAIKFTQRGEVAGDCERATASRRKSV